MSLYEQLIQEGREAGLQEGREAGRQEGRQEGHEAGRREVMHRAVKAMQKLNMDAAAIAAALEIPVGQVQQYLASLG